MTERLVLPLFIYFIKIKMKNAKEISEFIQLSNSVMWFSECTILYVILITWRLVIGLDNFSSGKASIMSIGQFPFQFSVISYHCCWLGGCVFPIFGFYADWLLQYGYLDELSGLKDTRGGLSYCWQNLRLCRLCSVNIGVAAASPQILCHMTSCRLKFYFLL